MLIEENLKEIASSLSEIANKAKTYTLSETDDWFDKVTVNRNMKELTNLSKSFGSRKAVDNLSLTIPEGSVFGFLGPNGAGKSTTIRMLMSIIQGPTLAGLGLLSWTILLHGMAALALMLGFMPVGAWLARRVRRETFDKLILVLLGAIAAKILVTAFL